MPLARGAPMCARCDAEAFPTFDVPADAEALTVEMVDRAQDE